MSMSCQQPQAPSAESRVTIRAPEGLHARPAIKFARLARRYAARIEMRAEEDERWIDAKSLAKLIGLHLESGRKVVLRATGTDAAAALVDLEGFIVRDFDEVGEPRT